MDVRSVAEREMRGFSQEKVNRSDTQATWGGEEEEEGGQARWSGI